MPNIVKNSGDLAKGAALGFWSAAVCGVFKQIIDEDTRSNAIMLVGGGAALGASSAAIASHNGTDVGLGEMAKYNAILTSAVFLGYSALILTSNASHIAQKAIKNVKEGNSNAMRAAGEVIGAVVGTAGDYAAYGAATQSLLSITGITETGAMTKEVAGWAALAGSVSVMALMGASAIKSACSGCREGNNRVQPEPQRPTNVIPTANPGHVAIDVLPAETLTTTPAIQLTNQNRVSTPEQTNLAARIGRRQAIEFSNTYPLSGQLPQTSIGRG